MSLFSRVQAPSDVFSRASQLLDQTDKLSEEYIRKWKQGDAQKGTVTHRMVQLRSQLEKQAEAVKGVKGKEHAFLREKNMKALADARRRLDQLITGKGPPDPSDSDFSRDEEDETSSQHSPPRMNPVTPQVTQVRREEVKEEQPKITKTVNAVKSAMYGGDEEDEDDNKGEEIPRGTVVRDTVVKSTVDKDNTSKRLTDDNVFIALDNLVPGEDGDLSLTKGELIRILETRSDGWWTGEKKDGTKGLVPRTFLGQKKKGEERREEQIQDRPTVSASPPTVPTVQPTVTSSADTVPAVQLREQDGRRRSLRSLGDAYANDKHVSLACHLTPRLSESNLAFHDLFWNHDRDMLRKRRVRLCKMVRIVRVEKTSGLGDGGGLVRMCLFDRTTKTGRQIVSNVHTIRARCARNEWTFFEKRESNGCGLSYGEFIVRSNYRQSRIHLLIQISTLEKDTDGKVRERGIGVVEVPLLDDSGNCILTSKSYAETLKEMNVLDGENSPSTAAPSTRRIIFKVRDVPREISGRVEITRWVVVDSAYPPLSCLPDVVLLNPLHLTPCFLFRRHAGRLLIRDRDAPMSAELVNDLLLALFPSLSDDSDVLDLVSRLWSSTEKALGQITEEQLTSHFRDFFSAVCLCLLARPLPPFSWLLPPNENSLRHKALDEMAVALSSSQSTSQLLSRLPSQPIRPHYLSFDLVGRHAID